MTCWAAFSAALLAGLIYRAGWLTDWDSMDYAAKAMNRQCSDLCLGRWWFIAAMRGAYLVGRQVFGLELSQGYLAMQSACMLAMGLAVVGLMLWTRRLSRLNSAAVLAAALVLPGPMVGIYASAVMTESFTLMLVMACYLAWEKSLGRSSGLWALLGGLLFGVAVDMREPAVLLAAWPIVSCFVDKPAHRWRLLGLAAAGTLLTLGFGVLMAWAWYPWTDRSFFSGLQLWSQQMARERETFRPHLLLNLRYLLSFLAVATPVGLPALGLVAIGFLLGKMRRMLGRNQGGSPAGSPRSHLARPAWAALAALPYTLSLLANHDLDVNPRFVLPLAWMIVPIVSAILGAWCQGLRAPVGAGLAKLRLAAASALVLGAALAGVHFGWRQIKVYYFDYVDQQQRMYQAMAELPPGSVVIPGAGTPVGNFLWLTGQRPDLRVIGSGWSWPGERLDAVVRGHLEAGLPVFVNSDPDSWTRSWRHTPEWEQTQALLTKYPSVSTPPVPEWLVRLAIPPATQSSGLR